MSLSTLREEVEYASRNKLLGSLVFAIPKRTEDNYNELERALVGTISDEVYSVLGYHGKVKIVLLSMEETDNDGNSKDYSVVFSIDGVRLMGDFSITYYATHFDSNLNSMYYYSYRDGERVDVDSLESLADAFL